MVIMELNNMADIFYVALSSETELAYKVKHAKFDDMDEDTKDLVKYFGPKYPDLTMGFLEASIFKVSDSINSLLDTEPELFHKQAPEDYVNFLYFVCIVTPRYSDPSRKISNFAQMYSLDERSESKS